MAIFKDLDERTHVYGVKTYADLAATAASTAYVDMSKYNSVKFLVGIGTNDTVGTIGAEQSTALDSSGTEAGLGFHYRLTGTIATDTMGAITYVDSTATLAYAAADDAKYYIIEPDQLTDGYRWCRLTITPSGTASATPCWVVAILSGPTYRGNVMQSAS